ncbi:MAG TPA: alkaline phosphatase family protein [Xanthobacteraceae bacterium]|jgi:phospholipase C
MNIAHVVVLMLENRSFDCMLGRLYPGRADFDGLTGRETNSWNETDVQAWASSVMDAQTASTPTPDPAELFDDMTEQIFGVGHQPPAAPTMGGFVANYMKTPGNDPAAVMHGFTPEQVPVLSALAQSFGVSDRWHAAAPNQTWPNRFFVHTGTAAGYVNNTPLHLYEMPTIFNRLTEKQRSWRIYSHDIPQSAALSRIWSELPDHLYPFEQDFMADAMAGRLPNYSFIEPRYFSDPLSRRMPNDQHPPYSVLFGERLIARVYDALRNGPGWEQTLFIITYDEHGGIFDHVPPPSATSPDDQRPDGFEFDRYGVRVPAVIVSPWVAAGSIIRPPAGSPYPFDHTSILATLRKLFDLGAPLTRRDAVAPDLLAALSLASPDNAGPPSLQVPAPDATDESVMAAHERPPNHMQQALAEMASQLPPSPAGVASHIAVLQAGGAPPMAPKFGTVREALAHAQAGLARFLTSPRTTLPLTK